MSHARLSVTGTKSVLNFLSKGTAIEMTWTTDPTRDNSKFVKYLGTLVIPNGSAEAMWKLSLYTLGLQGRRWKVKLTKGDFRIYDGQDQPLAGTGDSWTIPATGVADSEGKKNPADPDGIYFVEFTGNRLVLEVVSWRLRHVDHDGDGHGHDHVYFEDNHDTVPPPPDPGGEEGDGEEE